MFVTMDMELADRFLSSMCSIAIILWNDDGTIATEFFSYVNPDCEVEEFFADRHGLTNEQLKNAPTLPELWVEIYDLLKGRTVFLYDANNAMRALMDRAKVDILNVPPCYYASVKSLCKRTWKGLEDYSMRNVTEKLSISSKHNDAHEDAVSLGKLILKAMDVYDINNPRDLFPIVGFAGGYIKDNKKHPYKVKKDKKTNKYHVEL